MVFAMAASVNSYWGSDSTLSAWGGSLSCYVALCGCLGLFPIKWRSNDGEYFDHVQFLILTIDCMALVCGLAGVMVSERLNSLV